LKENATDRRIFRSLSHPLHLWLSLRPKIKELTKIKVGAVSYLNTKPLLYGIKRHAVMHQIDLMESYPAEIARSLIDGKLDLGLVPVAVIPKLKEHHIITDYCIGANGEVASVCIFSEVSLEEVKKVYLDYQSRTSVRLAQILLKEYWKVEVELIDAIGEDYIDSIKGTAAGVVIGDRALALRQKANYIYDLGTAWKAHTGLPFVFAAWISNKQLPEDFVQSFNDANQFGLNHIDELVENEPYRHFDLSSYFKKFISYELSLEKLKGLELFLSKIKEYKLA
jgi:chorismate dehydratase